MNRGLAVLLICVLSSTAAFAGAPAERDALKAYLASRGVTAEHVAARVDALSDVEAVELAGQLDNAPAGGGFEAVLYILAYAAVHTVVALVQILAALASSAVEAAGGRSRAPDAGPEADPGRVHEPDYGEADAEEEPDGLPPL